MKIRIALLIICSILFHTKTLSQVSSNKYETQLEKGLKKEHPEYYKGLMLILSEFQEHLIAKGIVKTSNYKSYTRILDGIHAGNPKTFEIEYNISDSLQKLVKDLNFKEPFPESFVNEMRYLNRNDSKTFLFNEKVSELIDKKEQLNRSTLANILLQVYDEKDFELPMIRLKIFRFLDPNSDSLVYIHSGLPNPE